VTLDRLWAGWRTSYIDEVATQRPVEGDCLFCRLLAADPHEALVLARDDYVFAVLNAYPYTSGHLMIAPVRHEATLSGLSPEEVSALMAMTQHATVALESAYSPDGMNIGANLGRAAGAGIPGHVHMHALPRWVGDTNFMTTVAEARVLPEPLTVTWEKLRAAW
jgi:diadenosine tetraphosphate (Ap4A) HIT family hydrolase